MEKNYIHENAMKKLCRICGCTLTGKLIYSVAESMVSLKNAFNVKFEEDTPNIHPKMYCRNCSYSLSHFETRGSATKINIVEWSKHSDGDCNTCRRLEQQAKGGRPAKKSRHGRPKLVGNTQTDPNLIDSSEILKLTPSKTIPPEVEKMVSHVVKLKMMQSTLPNNTIQLPSGGPQVRKSIYHFKLFFKPQN